MDAPEALLFSGRHGVPTVSGLEVRSASPKFSPEGKDLKRRGECRGIWRRV